MPWCDSQEERGLRYINFLTFHREKKLLRSSLAIGGGASNPNTPPVWALAPSPFACRLAAGGGGDPFFQFVIRVCLLWCIIGVRDVRANKSASTSLPYLWRPSWRCLGVDGTVCLSTLQIDGLVFSYFFGSSEIYFLACC
jgi:hypothetical protein